MPVFPACAGVILITNCIKFIVSCFPRMRGGDPFVDLYNEYYGKFSPHARG